MTLQEQIKTKMTEKNITAYQVSQKCGIDEAQLSRFFNNKGSISFKRIEQIIDYIGCELKLADK